MNRLENQRAAEPIDAVFQDLESLLMQNIARHLKDYGQPIATDQWSLKKLAEVGKLNKENMKIIAQMAGLSQTAVERMLSDASEKALDQVEPPLAYLTRQKLVDDAVVVSKSKQVKRTMRAMRSQAKDTLNLCNTTMLYKARDAYKTLVTKIASEADEIANKQSFIDRMNMYGTAVVMGAESRQAALRKCIREFNEKGIPAFVDKRGREWTPEAYVNMAMRNTAKNTADEVQTARCRDYGVHFIEISSHAGARPKCSKDQGKIFDLDNSSGYIKDAKGQKIRYYPWNSSSYGEPDGILGINCRHHKFPFWPGVSLQTYFPIDKEVNDRLYKQTQVQRALERSVRKQKRECMLYDQLEDKDAFEEASVKLKQKEAQLKDYVSKHPDLHRRRDREQVVGFDKRISAEAIGKAQKHYSDWAKSIGAEAGPKTLAGYYELQYNKDTKESRAYRGYVNAVKAARISPLVGYAYFKEVDKKVTEILTGLVTVSGMEVKGHTAHFVDRLIGTHGELSETNNRELTKRLNHAAVSIEEAKQAITEGEPGEIVTSVSGLRSQRFVGNNCIVTINPDTQELIQTNRKR